MKSGIRRLLEKLSRRYNYRLVRTVLTDTVYEDLTRVSVRMRSSCYSLDPYTG